MPETAKRPLEEMNELFTSTSSISHHDLERRVEEVREKKSVTMVEEVA